MPDIIPATTAVNTTSTNKDIETPEQPGSNLLNSFDVFHCGIPRTGSNTIELNSMPAAALAAEARRHLCERRYLSSISQAVFALERRLSDITLAMCCFSHAEGVKMTMYTA